MAYIKVLLAKRRHSFDLELLNKRNKFNQQTSNSKIQNNVLSKFKVNNTKILSSLIYLTKCTHPDISFTEEIQKIKKSISRHTICMGTNPISRTSRKQTIVATSTMETEYIETIIEYTKKILWIRNILFELFNFNKPIIIYNDNQANKTTFENEHLNLKLNSDVLTKNVNRTQMSKLSNIIFDKSEKLSLTGEC
ncbi:hypothetical protein H8356DRAFT_1363543 [Neocallimastix lanati (nom. inval.)]|nr:hypothetical protein H8356DRAFT_1363543 [Neocallimastix sp. JGI-2020a]